MICTFLDLPALLALRATSKYELDPRLWYDRLPLSGDKFSSCPDWFHLFSVRRRIVAQIAEIILTWTRQAPASYYVVTGVRNGPRVGKKTPLVIVCPHPNNHMTLCEDNSCYLRVISAAQGPTYEYSKHSHLRYAKVFLGTEEEIRSLLILALDNGLNPNYRKGTLLRKIIEYGDLRILQVLREAKGIDMTLCDDDGCNALHICARCGYSYMVYILSFHISSNSTDNMGRTPLMHVFFGGRNLPDSMVYNTIYYLISSANADVTIVDNVGNTAADYALLHPQGHMLEEITKDTTSTRSRGAMGMTGPYAITCCPGIIGPPGPEGVPPNKRGKFPPILDKRKQHINKIQNIPR